MRPGIVASKKMISLGMAAVMACVFAVSPVKAGAAKTFTDDEGIRYQVIKEAPTEDDNGTCMVIGAKNKSITDLEITSTACPEDEEANTEYDVVEIKKGAFKNYKKLKTVDIEGECEITKIPDNAFSGCKKLEEVNIEAEDLKTIGKNAFKGCKGLKQITIKSKLLKQGSIKKNAFAKTKSGLKVEGKNTSYSKKYAGFIKNRGGKNVKAVKVTEEKDDDDDDDDDDEDDDDD